MSYIGSWKIDDLLTFTTQTQSFSTGAETDADAAPSYRVYEDETGTPILTGTMALLDDANTIGFYSEQITLSAANGFEKGKSYNVRIRAVVGGVASGSLRNFQIQAEVDAERINWANIDNPTTAQNLSGTNIDPDQVVASVTGAVGSVTGAVGSVTGNVGGNVTGSVGSVAAGGVTTASFAAGAIDAAAIAANAIGASELAQDACQEIADELLNRNLAGGGSGGARIVRDAFRALRNRVAIAAGTATVYAEDDATPAWTAAVTTTAGNPVSEVDPA